MSRLASRVYVEGHGWFGPGDTVPAAAAKLITNPKAWAEAPEPESDGPPTAPIPVVGGSGIPPRAGKGSSKDAWAAYASEHDVDHDPDASRDEIVAAVEAAGVPVE